MNNDSSTDWVIRRDGDDWAFFKDGGRDDGRDAPASLKGIYGCLRTMPGPVPDLADLGVASTARATSQEFCPITNRRIRVSGFERLEPRTKRGDWEGALWLYGRRLTLHPDALGMLAPHLDAALRSFYSEPQPEPSQSSESDRRRHVAANLLVKAFERSGESSPVRSAWFVEQAIALLTKPAAETATERAARRQAVRG